MKMNRIMWATAIAEALNMGIKTSLGSSEKAFYPYRMGEKSIKSGRQPSHTKKGPGRRHISGKRAVYS